MATKRPTTSKALAKVGKADLVQLRQARDITLNAMTQRADWLRKLLDPRRDIFAECGHPATICTTDYQEAYERGDIARRVVNLFPEESWTESPSVNEDEDEEETAFEKAFDDLNKKFRIWSYLQRADMMSGIGRFGVLLFGFSDGKPLSEAVEGTNNELIYLRTFEENLVTVAKLNTDETNERFGLPETYTVNFEDASLNAGSKSSGKSVQIHWTRILHVADNRTNSEVYGTPRMQWVFNRLLDLKKIAGGSGEMFWKGGFPGISLESANPAESVVIDQDTLETQMDRYMNGLQRYIATVGMSAKSLAPQVADPRGHVETQLKLIAVAIGCPMRIFTGSEQAQLASGQDSKSWNKRIDRRREEYVTPFLVRPFVERLMEFGALPTIEDFEVKWPDLHTPSDEEKAKVAEHKTNAISKYALSGAADIVPVFQYLTMILGLTDEEAQGILDEVGETLEEIRELDMEAKKLGLEGQAAGIEGQKADTAQAGQQEKNGNDNPPRGQK